MTNQYSQEQVDEIGVFMANKLNESNQALKDFLQEQINNLVPVVPEPPETGEPVVPPATGGAGMFLDDGRQIKQKLLSDLPFVGKDIYVPHNLGSAKIISVSVLCVNNSSYLPPAYDLDPNSFKYNFFINKSNGYLLIKGVSTNNPTSYTDYTATVLITYLA